MPLLPQHHVDLDRLRELGANSTAAFLPDQWWLFRRVEYVSFIGALGLRRKISVDFEIPSGLPSTRRRSGPLVYVPLSVLTKWPPLLSFDLTVDDQPGHLLTASGNGEMDAALLDALIARCLGSHHSFCCRSASHALATRRGSEAWAAYDQLRGLLENAEPEDLRRQVLRIAHSMAQSQHLWVPVTGYAGDRHVAHFSYDVRYATSERFPIRAARTLAWGGGNEWLEIPHVGQTGSYHIDVEAPEGLLVMDTSVYFLYDKSRYGDETPDPPEVEIQQVGERTHIYTPSERPGSAFLVVRMMPRWRGFIGAAWLMAIGIAALLTAFWRWAPYLSQDATSSVAILVIAPAVLGVITLRSGVHPRTLDRLIGVQLLLFASASLSVFAALVAIRWEKHVEPTRAIWRDLGYGSYVIVIMIGISVVVAMLGERRMRTSDPDD